MTRQHRIPEALFDALYAALTNRRHWVLFRSDAYWLQKEDIHCFTGKEEALRYRSDLAPTAARYALIYAPTILSLYRQVEELRLYQHDCVTFKIKHMNEQNFEYLKDNLKYLGFGEGLTGKLRDEINRGEGSFQLTFEAEIHKKAFAAVLNFRKSDTTDHYFLNSFHATLQRSNGDIRDQAFYLNKGKGVTAKEAYNLLEGRAVYKELENREGQKYHAWLQVDFRARDKHNNYEMKQYHQAYGFDLTATLQKYAIRELQSPDQRDVLVASLQRGNLQAVAMEKEGASVRMFLEAAPQYKALNFYDEKFGRVNKEALEPYLVAGTRMDHGLEKTAGTVQEPQAGLKNGRDVGPSEEGLAKGTSVRQGQQGPRDGVGNKEQASEKRQSAGDDAAKGAKTVKDLLPKKGGEPGKGIKMR